MTLPQRVETTPANWLRKNAPEAPVFAVKPDTGVVIGDEPRAMQAFRLLYENYAAQGYVAQTASRIHFSPFQLLPEARILGICEGPKVTATLTQVVDSETAGLPMDSLFRKELDELRDKGRRLVELCAFASYNAKSPRLALQLQRTGIRRALAMEATDLCIMVNPRHAPYYKRMYLCEALCEDRMYPFVGASATPLRLDLTVYEERLAHRAASDARWAYYAELLAFCFGAPAVAACETINGHLGCTFSWDFVRKTLSGRPDILESLPGSLEACFEAAYPGILAECGRSFGSVCRQDRLQAQ